MRLLLDENLSRHLVSQLSIQYPKSRHVTDFGLDTATDDAPAAVLVAADIDNPSLHSLFNA